MSIREVCSVASSAVTDPISILIVYDDQPTIQLCRDIFFEAGIDSRSVTTTEEALDVLEHFPVDAVITGLLFPERGGIELLRIIREKHPDIASLVLTRDSAKIESAAEAIRLGAFECIAGAVSSGELRLKLLPLIRHLHLHRYVRNVRLEQRRGMGGLIGLSPEMLSLYTLIDKVAHHHCPALILGESGTGKELVARAVHSNGPRSSHPFVPVDCSALAPTLIESELFGHMQGAFTGAARSKQGLLESANGGTLFLDEIGDLPLDLQPKLLRVLQEKEVRPLGSIERRPISARIVAATNRDLEAAVRQGRFREDLYFRLNIVQIKLPPLRERKTDIPLLVSHFLEKFAGLGPDVKDVRPDAMARLMAYHWSGNVRELENTIERAVILSSRSVLAAADFPVHIMAGARMDGIELDTTEPLEGLRRTAILRALEATGGDKGAAARMLGIGKTTVYRKLKEYNSPLVDAERLDSSALAGEA